MLISLLGCNRKDIAGPVDSNMRVIAEDLPPVMGGDLDRLGNLLTFSLPLLGNDQYNDIIVTAKLNKISNKGDLQQVYSFNKNHFSFGTWSRDTIANASGWIPGGTHIDLVQKNNNELIMSYNRDDKLFIYSNNTLSSIQAVKGIESITKNSKGELLFITSPIYKKNDSDYSLTSPPIIYKLDSSNSISEFYRFPMSSNYGYSGLAGSQGELYPIDILINIATDKKDNIYICFGYENTIYKLDSNNTLSTYRNDIYCPTSIAFDQENNPFISSGPQFSKYEINKYKIAKPLEIIKIASNKKEILFSKNDMMSKGGYIPDENNNSYKLPDAKFNIVINHMNEIFLEDPTKGDITLIKY